MIVFKGNPKKLKEFIYKDGKLYNRIKKCELSEVFSPDNEYKDIVLLSEEFKDNFKLLYTGCNYQHQISLINGIFLINEDTDIDTAMEKFRDDFFRTLKPYYNNIPLELKGQVIYFTFKNNNKTFVSLYIYYTPSRKEFNEVIVGKNNVHGVIYEMLDKHIPDNRLFINFSQNINVCKTPHETFFSREKLGFFLLFDNDFTVVKFGSISNSGGFVRENKIYHGHIGDLRFYNPPTDSEEIIIKCCSYTGTAMDFLDLKLGS